MRLIVLAIFSLLFQNFTFSQGCCSGGGSNPIAGGGATGVLQQYQMERLMKKSVLGESIV